MKMRIKRQKRVLMSEGCEAVYHCISRTCGGERVFGDREKEVFRKQMRQVADFCGVEVLTYCVMSNHFHVLLRVPAAVAVSDDELIRRMGVLYVNEPERLASMEAMLRNGGENGDWLRGKLLARMGNVSVYMKELKQRFSIWFNQSRGRFGTVWSERFKSVLVQPSSAAVRVVAAYIDLNPIRAGMVEDPKDYRFCGYGEAIGGSKLAQTGLCGAMREEVLSDALEAYRVFLYARGSQASKQEKDQSLSPEQAHKEMEKGGRLPLATVLRCRVRYMTDGAVLGSAEFVRARYEEHRECVVEKGKKAFHKMRGAEWGEMVCLRGLRKDVFG